MVCMGSQKERRLCLLFSFHIAKFGRIILHMITILATPPNRPPIIEKTHIHQCPLCRDDLIWTQEMPISHHILSSFEFYKKFQINWILVCYNLDSPISHQSILSLKFWYWRLKGELCNCWSRTLPFYFLYENKGVCHTVTLPFTLKNILRQKKKNYGNSNISPCQNIIFKKNSLKETKDPSSYYNSIITNLEFQHKPKYHLSKILI